VLHPHHRRLRRTLEQLARFKDKYQRLPYYASCFGVIKATISRELTWRRVQDGKKPINVVKIQKTPSNGDLIRMYDMMLGCLDAILEFAQEHGIEAIGYEDESKVCYGPGNWPQYARALAGEKVSGELPHHPTSATVYAAIEAYRIVKIDVTDNAARGNDVGIFMNTDTPRPDFAPHLGGPPVWSTLRRATIIMVDLLGGLAPQTTHSQVR
jgi:hypothetical protein